MNPKPILSLGVLLACTGCTLAPKFHRPASTVPENWAKGDSTSGPTAADIQWREFFADPGMRGVIELALANNLDLKVAALNVDKAQAAYRIQRAELTPTVGVQASSENYRVSAKEAGSGPGYVYRQSWVYIPGVSWELDFFGRIRSLKDQALNTYFATEQAKVASQITLVASVGQAYLQYAADAETLALAQSTLESQRTNGNLLAKSHEVGVASALDLKQAQSQVDSARSEVARCRRLLAMDKNALDLLVGLPVPAERLPKGLSTVGSLKDVSAGLSSNVLLGRPDILMAEYQLKAASANIGAARAAFFPSVSLTAGIGTMSSDLSSLFQSGSRTWLFYPTVSIPIFSGGALKANLEVSKINRDISVAQYQKAIQTGFREVADGLIQRESLVDQVQAQQSLVNVLEESYRLAQARYQEGLDGYLTVLVAQRSLYAAQQGLVATKLAHQVNQITIYKALGGKI